MMHVPFFQIYTTYDAKSCCTYMLENVAVSKYFLLQRIKAPAGRMEVSPGWKQVILARERRQSASIDGGLAGVAAPASAKLLEKWIVAFDELQIQEPLVLLQGGQSHHCPQLHHLGEEVCTVARDATKHGAVSDGFPEGIEGSVWSSLPPPHLDWDVLQMEQNGMNLFNMCSGTNEVSGWAQNTTCALKSVKVIFGSIFNVFLPFLAIKPNLVAKSQKSPKVVWKRSGFCIRALNFA